MLPGLIVGGLLSLPGLLPGIAINLGADGEIVTRANVIYVYERLPHHLSFFGMSKALRNRFALLVAAWVLLAVVVPADEGRRRLRRRERLAPDRTGGDSDECVGRLQPQMAAGWLRFYWFRLADALVPLGVALWSVALVASWSASRPGRQMVATVALLAFAGWQLSPQLVARFDSPVPRRQEGESGESRRLARCL